MYRRLLAPALFLASLAACAQSTTPPATAKPAAGPAAAAAPAPRVGVDYEVLAPAQPTFINGGKIEIAEVFSYQCIHCAEFQPLVNTWKRTMPSTARWQYVPAVFGSTWDNFARAFYAAEIMGIQQKTHDAVFKAVFVDKSIKGGSLDNIADMYAGLGVDRTKFLATMNSFGVTAKINRAKQFALRTGITATPTIIINGKYRLNVTTDRGFPGMLSTATYLIAKESAEAAPAAKPATAAPAKK
jgi:thiol:disulfide interchange protein DsbA